MLPLISVCLPTRDRLSYLRQTLDAILAQTHSDYEVIVCDNWSGDGTREFCLEIERLDPRVRYMRPPAPVGLYANHNAAYRRARGSYVSFVHDDDLYDPRMLARFAEFLDRHPTVGIVSSDWNEVDGTGRRLGTRVSHVPAVSTGLAYIDRTIRSARSEIALSGSMSRRDALPDPPFDEQGPLGFTDHVTWFRVAERWDVGHIPEALWSYRRHAGALSRKGVREIAADYTAAFTAYVDEYARRHPQDRSRAASWRAAIRRYRFWALAYARLARVIPTWAIPHGEVARRLLRLG